MGEFGKVLQELSKPSTSTRPSPPHGPYKPSTRIWYSSSSTSSHSSDDDDKKGEKLRRREQKQAWAEYLEKLREEQRKKSAQAEGEGVEEEEEIREAPVQGEQGDAIVEGEQETTEQPATEQPAPTPKVTYKRKKTLGKKGASKKRKTDEGCSPEPVNIPDDSDEDEEDNEPLSSLIHRKRKAIPSQPQTQTTTSSEPQPKPTQTPAPTQISQTIQTSHTVQEIPSSSSAPVDKGKKPMDPGHEEELEKKKKEDEKLRKEARVLGMTLEEYLQAREEYEQVLAKLAEEVEELPQSTPAPDPQADPIWKQMVSQELAYIKRRNHPARIYLVAIYVNDQIPRLKVTRTHSDKQTSAETLRFNNIHLYGFTELIELEVALERSRNQRLDRYKQEFLQSIRRRIQLAISEGKATQEDYEKHKHLAKNPPKKASQKGKKPFPSHLQEERHIPTDVLQVSSANLNTKSPLNITPEMFRYIKFPEPGIFFMDSSGVWKFFREREISKATDEFLFNIRWSAEGKTGSEEFEALINDEIKRRALTHPEIKEEEIWRYEV